MKKISIYIGAAVAFGWLSVTTQSAEAYPSILDWARGVYYGGRAVQDMRRDNPFGAVDNLLRFPTPTNPFRYLPRPMQQRLQDDIRKIDPAHRYGPEYQDLFR